MLERRVHQHLSTLRMDQQFVSKNRTLSCRWICAVMAIKRDRVTCINCLILPCISYWLIIWWWYILNCNFNIGSSGFIFIVGDC